MARGIQYRGIAANWRRIGVRRIESGENGGISKSLICRRKLANAAVAINLKRRRIISKALAALANAGAARRGERRNRGEINPPYRSEEKQK